MTEAPRTTQQLEQLIRVPELFEIGIEYGPIRDILLDVVAKVDTLASKGFRTINTVDDDEPKFNNDDVKQLQQRVEEVAKLNKQQNTDFNTEIREMKAFFQFQLKDIRDKYDKNINKLANSISNPQTPRNEPIIEYVSDDVRYDQLSRQVNTLTARFENLLKLVNNSAFSRTTKVLSTDDSQEEMPIVIKPITFDSPTKSDENDNVEGEKFELDLKNAEIDEISDAPQKKIHEPCPSQPVSPTLKPFVDITIPSNDGPKKDPRVDDIVLQIKQVMNDVRGQAEKFNKTIPTINNLIKEVEKQGRDMVKVKAEVKGRSDEFDRIYDKMADISVDVDKKLTDFLKTAKEQNEVQILEATKPETTANDFNSAFQSIKNTFIDNLDNIDSNYRAQIHYLKQEITQLKSQIKKLGGTLKEIREPEIILKPSESIQMESNGKNDVSTEEEHVKSARSLQAYNPDRKSPSVNSRKPNSQKRNRPTSVNSNINDLSALATGRSVDSRTSTSSVHDVNFDAAEIRVRNLKDYFSVAIQTEERRIPLRRFNATTPNGSTPNSIDTIEIGFFELPPPSNKEPDFPQPKPIMVKQDNNGECVVKGALSRHNSNANSRQLSQHVSAQTSQNAINLADSNENVHQALNQNDFGGNGELLLENYNVPGGITPLGALENTSGIKLDINPRTKDFSFEHILNLNIFSNDASQAMAKALSDIQSQMVKNQMQQQQWQEAQEHAKSATEAETDSEEKMKETPSNSGSEVDVSAILQQMTQMNANQAGDKYKSTIDLHQKQILELQKHVLALEEAHKQMAQAQQELMNQTHTSTNTGTSLINGRKPFVISPRLKPTKVARSNSGNLQSRSSQKSTTVSSNKIEPSKPIIKAAANISSTMEVPPNPSSNNSTSRSNNTSHSTISSIHNNNINQDHPVENIHISDHNSTNQFLNNTGNNSNHTLTNYTTPSNPNDNVSSRTIANGELSPNHDKVLPNDLPQRPNTTMGNRPSAEPRIVISFINDDNNTNSIHSYVNADVESDPSLFGNMMTEDLLEFRNRILELEKSFGSLSRQVSSLQTPIHTRPNTTSNTTSKDPSNIENTTSDSKKLDKDNPNARSQDNPPILTYVPNTNLPQGPNTGTQSLPSLPTTALNSSRVETPENPPPTFVLGEHEDPSKIESDEDFGYLLKQHKQYCDDQFRILRENYNDIRTNVQAMKSKSLEPVVLPQSLDMSSMNKDIYDIEASEDSPVVKALRRRIDAAAVELESQINDVRKELYLYMQTANPQIAAEIVPPQPSTPPEEKVTDNKEKEQVKKPQHKKEQKSSILAKLDQLQAEQFAKLKRKFIEDLESPRIIKLHNYTDLVAPEPVKLKKDPIIDKPPPETKTPTIKPSKDEPTKKVSRKSKDDSTVDHLKEILPILAPPPTTTPSDENRFIGRNIPQPVKEVNVTNAEPDHEMIDSVLPYLIELRTDLQLKVETALERARIAEESMQNKVDKEFVNDFFRKMRIMMIDLKQQVEEVKSTIPDKVTKDDLNNLATDLFKTVTKEQSATAGTVNYRCLFCGAERKNVSGITDKTVVDALGDPQQAKLANQPAIQYAEKPGFKGRVSYNRSGIASKLESRKVPPLRATTAIQIKSE